VTLEDFKRAEGAFFFDKGYRIDEKRRAVGMERMIGGPAE
jgi:hypothetical protein